MTLQDIYETSVRASTEMARLIEAHCGYELSRDEISRITDKAVTPEEFEDVWENTDWWTDANNA